MKINIIKEPHPEPQRPEDQKMKCAFCAYPIYATSHGATMLELRNSCEMWQSKDNGTTWHLLRCIPVEEKISNSRYLKWSLGPLVHDRSNDILICFEYCIAYGCPVSEIVNYAKHCDFLIPESILNFYRSSRDGGTTWSKRRQLRQAGLEFDDDNYSERHSLSGGGFIQLGEAPPYLNASDGALILPFQGRSRVNHEIDGSIQAGRFYGVWDEEMGDYEWHVRSGYVPGGGCEQTIERLKDGRLLNIIRVQGVIEPYYCDLRYRPYSISEDDGVTWSKPAPLRWDDGAHVVSPRSWSQLIRANHGTLYWIANILPDLDRLGEETLSRLEKTDRADPRFPLVIAEVDESSLTLKRKSEAVIIDRQPYDGEFVRYSNFFCYNNRESGDINMLMMKSYHENQHDIEEMPHPAWRFRISFARNEEV